MPHLEGLPEQILAVRQNGSLGDQLPPNATPTKVQVVIGQSTGPRRELSTAREAHSPSSDELRRAGENELQLLIGDLTRAVNNFLESRIQLDETIQSRTYPRMQLVGNELLDFNGMPSERIPGLHETNGFEHAEVTDLVHLAFSFNSLTQRLRELQMVDSAFDGYEPFYKVLDWLEAFKAYSWSRARLIDLKSFASAKKLRPADLEREKVFVLCTRAISQEAAALRKFAQLNSQHFPSPRTEHIFASMVRIAEAWEPTTGKKHRVERFFRWWNEDPRKYERQGSCDGLEP